MNAPLNLAFVYAIPLRGTSVQHEGECIRVSWRAGTPCAIRLTGNAEGDIEINALRLSALRLRLRYTGPDVLSVRALLRGGGWLAAHTELAQVLRVPVGEHEVDLDTADFRLCQNAGPAASLQLEWNADADGELTLLALIPIEQTAQEFFAPRVDRYGQRIRGNWPGKVRNDDELRADALLPAPAAMPGVDGPPDFPAAGFFRTALRDGAWWLVTPEGRRFLSLGSCCVSPGVIRNETRGREELYQELPPRDGIFQEAWEGARNPKHFESELRTRASIGRNPESTVVNFYIANLIRKFGADWFARWGENAVARLRHWGFNTLGCWSDLELASTAAMPYVVPADVVSRVDFADLLPGPNAAPFPLQHVPDVFHPDFEAKARGWFSSIAAYRDDPFLIGYFVGNEDLWFLWQSPFSLPAQWESRRVFVRELEQRYATIDKLNAAWSTSFRSFQHLNQFRHAENPPGLSPEGVAACDDFMRRFTDRYFGRVRTELIAADPNHLFLGCRFLAMPPRPCIVEGASRHMDVVSVNWYLWHHQKPEDAGTFLGNWHRLTGGKPLLMSEYSFTATDERLLAGMRTHATQSERAAISETMTRELLRQPFVVGAHWFQYVDEPVLGRSLADGERSNFGLVDVVDRPYPELTAALQRVAARMYDRRRGPHDA